ncbi:hypothetical protein LB507_006647 [Fusarium sp. FIESC RH6]|nr:hypothetical protein LB507_006647 [Fusarium sp. FIESC RH6]
MTRHFQFITVPDPTERISPQLRKLAHSHVLRQRHANARHSRIKSYQGKLRVRQSPPGDAVQTNNAFQSRMISYCMDPFSALIRPLTSQEYHLLDYYVGVTVPYKVTYCDLLRDQILRDWVGLALNNENLLDSAIFLSASQDLLRADPTNPTLKTMTLSYKQKGLCTLRRALCSSEEAYNLARIAQALALAFSEVISP